MRDGLGLVGWGWLVVVCEGRFGVGGLGLGSGGLCFWVSGWWLAVVGRGVRWQVWNGWVGVGQWWMVLAGWWVGVGRSGFLLAGLALVGRRFMLVGLGWVCWG